MHSSEQSSGEQPVEPPFYEFLPAQSIPYSSYEQISGAGEVQERSEEGSTSANQPVVEKEQPLSEELIRQGLIYPPPPSFYQNVQKPAEVIVETQREQRFVPPAPDLSSYSPGERIQPPFAGSLPPQVPVKKPRKWIWIVASLFGALLLISCGLCSWAIYSVAGPTFQEASTALTVVDRYYAAVQDNNYPAAYKYIAPTGTLQDLTQQKFTQQAQQAEKSSGAITAYRPSPSDIQVDTSTGSSITHITLNVTVERVKGSYTVILTVQKIAGQWKITSYNKI